MCNANAGMLWVQFWVQCKSTVRHALYQLLPCWRVEMVQDVGLEPTQALQPRRF